MSQVIRLLDHARVPGPATAPILRLGPALAGALAAGAAACGLLAWNLAAFIGRYDTLAWLLQDVHSAERAGLRSLLLATGAALIALGALALFSWRLSLGLSGGALLLAGMTAGPLVRAWMAPLEGLEESLLYRLRGFSAIGVLGGAFLLFLSLIPAILDRPASGLETGMADRVRRAVRFLQAAPATRRRIALGVVAFVLASGVALLVLQDFPNSSDENSYLTQARIFATGKLWVDAPQSPDHFRARSFILDEARGRFFAKAFPGWAAILSLGVRAGAPWAVNPLLSALALVLSGWAGGRLLGRNGEWAVVGMILATPFFLLNAASYYNHPATVCLIALYLVAAIRLSEGASVRWAVVAGLACAAVLWVRPVPAVVLALPIGIWLGSRWARAGRWDVLAAAAAPVVVALAGLAAYNRHMFGSMWRSGYSAYDPQDIQPGLGADHLAITAWWILKLCFWLVPGTLAGLWFLLSGRRLRGWFEREPILVLMLGSLAAWPCRTSCIRTRAGTSTAPGTTSTGSRTWRSSWRPDGCAPRRRSRASCLPHGRDAGRRWPSHSAPA